MDSARNFVVSTEAPNVERTSQEELERINAFKLPDVVTPSGAPRKVNQFVKTAAAEGYRWAENVPGLLDIYRTPADLQKAYKTKAPEGILFIYPDCGEEEAIVLVKFILWTLYLDDYSDDPTFFRSPEKSMTLNWELNVMLMWSFPDDEQFYKNFGKFLDEGEVGDRTQALHYLQVKLDEARLRPCTGARR
ncbi:unnamed protein product [Calypogeia fissa]